MSVPESSGTRYSWIRQSKENAGFCSGIKKADLYLAGFYLSVLKDLFFSEVELVAGINPLLQDDLSVFAHRQMHRIRTVAKFVSHNGTHVDSDRFGIFSNRVGRHGFCSFVNTEFEFISMY